MKELPCRTSPVQLEADCFAQGHSCDGEEPFRLTSLRVAQWGLMVNIKLLMFHTDLCCFSLSYPKLADEEARILQAHVALLFDDLLDSLENIPCHCNIPTHVDVSSFFL